MNLIKWKRNDEVFPSNFSNLLDEFFNDRLLQTPGAVTTKPSVNVRETATSYELEVAAPGFTKNDFDINVDGNILTITGKKETKKEEDQNGFTRREFNYASFQRTFTLPETVNVDEIKGTYTDGILNVALPKKVEATAPKKTIKVS